MRALRRRLGGERRRDDLLLRVHVLPVVRRDDGLHLSELQRRARLTPEAGDRVTGRARHLYVHLPFCAHRCGYCDFVTVVGRRGQHRVYVDALLQELELEHGLLAAELETVFLGGGTPAVMRPPEPARALPPAGANRVSLGAQTFRPRLLEVLERVAQPDDVRRAVHHLRDAGFDNISLDLIYGIPGQSASDLEADLDDALALEPEHLSCYELEAKPGTRFTHAWGAELLRQADAMEDYFLRVVARLTRAGYRWYETANFCRADAEGRDLRSRHNLAYWLGRDYLGLGIGAVSTIENRRWRDTPPLACYLDAPAAGPPPGHPGRPPRAAGPGRGRRDSRPPP